jgi:calcineurin-like phosphoesterase family protein
MSRIFVVGDPHFGTKSIRFLPGREKLQTMTMEEHDEFLIQNWNAVVTKRDKVYLLGDIGRDLSGTYMRDIRDRLAGRIEVVGGNHDTAELLQLFGDKVHGVVTYNLKGIRLVLTHIPIHPQEMYWGYNIHGHLHTNVVKEGATTPDQGRAVGPSDPRYINACLEHYNFYPQPLEALVDAREATRKATYKVPTGYFDE